MANKDFTFELDVETEASLLRFWQASYAKTLAATAIERAIAARTNPENGLAAKGQP